MGKREDGFSEFLRFSIVHIHQVTNLMKDKDKNSGNEKQVENSYKYVYLVYLKLATLFFESQCIPSSYWNKYRTNTLLHFRYKLRASLEPRKN